MKNVLRFEYSDIHQLCASIVRQIQMLPLCQQPTSVVGIVRGGAIPAVILSHMLDIPLTMVSYSSLRGKGDDKNHSNKIPGNVLTTPNQILIDDIVDTGYTMKELSGALESAGNHTFITAALILKAHPAQQHNPTYYGHAIVDQDQWVVFPWEHEA